MGKIDKVREPVFDEFEEKVAEFLRKYIKLEIEVNKSMVRWKLKLNGEILDDGYDYIYLSKDSIYE